jgi:hypothetical protein
MQKGNIIKRGNQIERYFETLDDVTVVNIKLYYLKLLEDISEEEWRDLNKLIVEKRKALIVSNDFIDAKGNKITKSASIGPGVTIGSNFTIGSNQNLGKPLMRLASEQMIPTTKSVVKGSVSTNTNVLNNGTCAIYVTTKDAFTLTDGPTIFLATDVEKVAKFCIQQANIPAKVMEDIVEKIHFNNNINEKLSELEKTLEDMNEKRESNTQGSNLSGDKNKKLHKLERGYDENKEGNKTMKNLLTEMDMLRAMIKVTKLNDIFVPNTNAHLKKWAEEFSAPAAFKSDIDDETIVKIMLLKNVADSWKVLLLMGIGVFTNHESIEYTEIMKNLADQQKLYLIIASSDYIYGTNYQFCHGYISKDTSMTQEKIIQSMGRVGRNKIMQNYTIRFRDEEQILKIFTDDVEKPEVRNMNRLFSSTNNQTS